MKWMITAMVFIMVSVVIAGGLLTLALTMPQLGLDQLHSIGWVVACGFGLSIPASYVIAGRILAAERPTA